MTTTYLAYVHEDPQPGDILSAEGWREWRGIRPADVATFPQLVLHRWLRDRGGLAWGESMAVTVYTCPADVERHPSGRPIACLGTVFNVSRDREAAHV